MSGKKGMNHYPREVKMEAVRMFFEKGMTRAEITVVDPKNWTVVKEKDKLQKRVPR